MRSSTAHAGRPALEGQPAYQLPPPPPPPPPPEEPPLNPLPPDPPGVLAIVPVAVTPKLSIASENASTENACEETYQFGAGGTFASPWKACAHFAVSPKTMAYGR